MGVGFGAALATAIATQPLPNGAEACGRLRRENAENATKWGDLRKATVEQGTDPNSPESCTPVQFWSWPPSIQSMA